MADWLRTLARRAIPRRIRNFLRAPGKTVQWWTGDLRSVVAFPVSSDCTLACPRNALDFAFTAEFADPAQHREMDAFIGLIKGLPQIHLLDIGSHFGIFSLVAAHYGGNQARCLAVDPSPLAGLMVRKLTALNHFEDQIRFLHAAAGDRQGFLEMVETGMAGAGYMVLPKDHPKTDRIAVPTLTLEGIAREFGRTPTVIKIDIESFEYEVLLAAGSYLKQHSMPLCLELHHQMMRERGLDPARLVQHLADCGYTKLLCADQSISTAATIEHPHVRVIAFKAG